MLDGYVQTLQQLLDSPWLWLALFLTAALDALLPFMPSETTVVTAAVLIGPDPGRLTLLTLLAAAGAFAGDLGGHALGRRAGPRLLARFLRGERGRRRYAWAAAALARHGPLLIVAGRYVPGGRVAVGLTTGALRYPLRRFARYDAVGSALWAVFAVCVGALGGAAFADRPLYGLVLSFGLVTVVSVAVECVRRRRTRRGGSGPPVPVPVQPNGAHTAAADPWHSGDPPAHRSPGKSPRVRM
ncbi:DedA family protein [Streptomyces indicus]|uniref:Membrane protein DedA, SNARE-associated domain n=1 Tax=Streptomyces indicus TaxID=417292 RepID=A0A1G9A756_9ACTN|nr:VTT domain-containing protein [Streptomyces indicus]SDK23159.1 membrane protein DedA, SNARE-associated domain [Streptomyces indicus]